LKHLYAAIHIRTIISSASHTLPYLSEIVWMNRVYINILTFLRVQLHQTRII